MWFLFCFDVGIISGMKHINQPFSVLRSRLLQLNHDGIILLAAKSGVPYPTLAKIRSGETKNPGILTVEQFVPFLRSKSK
jgi:hypothetical protein